LRFYDGESEGDSAGEIPSRANATKASCTVRALEEWLAQRMTIVADFPEHAGEFVLAIRASGRVGCSPASLQPPKRSWRNLVSWVVQEAFASVSSARLYRGVQ
jgi:hypothetical protein